MEWNDEMLQELTDFSKLPSFTSKEVAVALGLDVELFLVEIMNPTSPIAKAFLRGRLLAKAELDKRIQTLSKQGSGPAQTLELKLRRETQINQLLELYG
jgi:hypothetical protein